MFDSTNRHNAVTLLWPPVLDRVARVFAQAILQLIAYRLR